MILQNSVPQLKTFLRNLALPAISAEHVWRLVAGFVFHVGRMSASAAATVFAEQARHRAQIGRCLRDSGLGDCSSFYRQLTEYVQHGLGCRRKRILIVLDKTHVSRQGVQTPNTFSTGNRQRRPCKSRRYNPYTNPRRNCQAFVNALVLLPDGTRIPYSLTYYTRAVCQKSGRQHLTESDLGACLLRTISLPECREVIVVADTAYESRAIRQACATRKFYWITPLNPERVLEGPRPRPKVSSRLATLTVQDFSLLRFHRAQGAFARQRRVSATRRGPKNKPRTYYVHEERLDVHSLGKVRTFFSTKRKPMRRTETFQRRDFKLLVTNHPSASCRDVIEMYDLRWQIELFFKELKSGLGAHQYRFRNTEAVAAWYECALITYLYLEWYRRQQLVARGTTRRQKRWWECQRTVTLARALRRATERQQLTQFERCCRTQGGLKRLRKALRAACPLEDRPSMVSA